VFFSACVFVKTMEYSNLSYQRIPSIFPGRHTAFEYCGICVSVLYQFYCLTGSIYIIVSPSVKYDLLFFF
jgi:hypothetical protein